MKIKLLLLIFVFFTLILTYTAFGLAPQEAKTELRNMNIAYSESEFLYRAEAGDTTAVSLFLDAGMNPNTKDKYGWTALMYATWGRIHEMQVNLGNPLETAEASKYSISSKYEITMRLLIQKGADINAKTNNGKSVAWIEAHFGNNIQSLAYIESTTNNSQPGYYVDRMFVKGPDRLGALQELLALKYEYTEASFLKAVKKGDVKAVLLFLTVGINPNAKDKSGKTALQIAQSKNLTEIVKLLKHSGAKQ
jgi:ankyrin repeat protein